MLLSFLPLPDQTKTWNVRGWSERLVRTARGSKGCGDKRQDGEEGQGVKSDYPLLSVSLILYTFLKVNAIID